MGRVLLNREESSGIDGTGDKSECKTEMPVGMRRALPASESARISYGHFSSLRRQSGTLSQPGWIGYFCDSCMQPPTLLFPFLLAWLHQYVPRLAKEYLYFQLKRRIDH